MRNGIAITVLPTSSLNKKRKWQSLNFKAQYEQKVSVSFGSEVCGRIRGVDHLQ
jgi:hypothetical protein